MSALEQFLQILDQAIALYGNANKLATAMGMHPNLITRWRGRKFVPALDTIQPILDVMGYSFCPNSSISDSSSVITGEISALRAENQKLKDELRDARLRAQHFEEALRIVSGHAPQEKNQEMQKVK